MNAKDHVESILRKTRRADVENLITWLAESDFYNAPASTRPDYHGCYPGGLARHSLNVYEVFRKRVEEFGLHVGQDEMAIASICHDLCKVGTYKPNVLKSGNTSASKPYVVDEVLPLGHGEKSVAVATRIMHLTDKESLLIRWHMGTYDPAWEIYGDKVQNSCPAITAFHHADMEASRYLD